MAEPRKTYFVAPTRTHPPNGRIVLGNVIEQPQWPEESVLNERIVPIPKACGPYEHRARGWYMSDTKGYDVTPGVFASFLSQILGVGADVEVGRKKELEEGLVVRELETQTIEPSKTYVDEVMKEDTLRSAVLKKKLWQRSGRVYMITGIKIARGASALTRRLAELHMHVQLTANLGILTGTGVPVDVGPKIDHKNSNERKEGFAEADDFVYAYRLSRITMKDGKYVTEQYHHGALLDDSEDDSGDDTDRMNRMTFELADVNADEEVDGTVEEVDDEDGSKVNVVKLG